MWAADLYQAGWGGVVDATPAGDRILGRSRAGRYPDLSSTSLACKSDARLLIRRRFGQISSLLASRNAQIWAFCPRFFRRSLVVSLGRGDCPPTGLLSRRAELPEI